MFPMDKGHINPTVGEDGNPLCPNPECYYDFKRIDLQFLGYLGNELDENMEKLVRLWAVRELESGNYCGGPFSC
jgi:hypothetical protein